MAISRILPTLEINQVWTRAALHARDLGQAPMRMKLGLLICECSHLCNPTQWLANI